MVALITGGSSGMGLEFARGLAARGYDLLLVSNSEDQLESAFAALSTEFPVKVRTLFRDLAQPKAADELFSHCISEGMLPDVLVNDAGMFFFKELDAGDLDRVQAMLDLHVNTVTRMCLLFGSAMKERGSGFILNGKDRLLHRYAEARSFRGLQIPCSLS